MNVLQRCQPFSPSETVLQHKKIFKEILRTALSALFILVVLNHCASFSLLTLLLTYEVATWVIRRWVGLITTVWRRGDIAPPGREPWAAGDRPSCPSPILASDAPGARPCPQARTSTDARRDQLCVARSTCLGIPIPAAFEKVPEPDAHCQATFCF